MARPPASRSRPPSRQALVLHEPPTAPHSNNRPGTQPTKKKKKKTRRRLHRAYGLPNANQIFLTMVVVALLFVQLLRPHWLVFPQSDATAGLSGLRLASSVNDTTTRVAWGAFCDPFNYNYTLPLDTTILPALTQPFPSRQDAVEACSSNTPETVRVLTAAAIACSMLSVTVALYFHLGGPSQRQVVLLGVVPGVMLLATGVLGTAALAIWQQHFGPYDNGDCFSVATASTVIAYVVAISMAIRWRWPGIFAVDDEQQAFEVRRNWRRRPRPITTDNSDNDDDNDANSADSPQTTDAFHAVV